MRYLLRVLLLALVPLHCFVADAQDYRAKVQGVVTDASDAAVVGAKVTLVNTETGLSARRLSGQTGRYIFDFVEPGPYRLTVDSPGFNQFVQDNIIVQVRGDVTVMAVLKVGAVSETVSVSEAAMAIQFNTSAMSLTIDRKMLDDLPIQQRNPFSLALLDPAVVNRYNSTRYPFYMWSSSRMDVGGGTDMKNDLLLDGAPLQIGQKGSYAPPMDSVQEFVVQQSGVDAEFGHSGGGTLSVGMKSGTNEFHGTGYYFGKNPALNAVTNSVTRTPNLTRNHIWGGTLGNPIVRNKLFTFTAYEGWKTKDPQDRFYTLPTDLERKGDYSQSLTISGGPRTIYDPFSTQFDSVTGKVTRTAFPNNAIPSSRIDPTSARMLEDIWLPSGPGDDITHSSNFKAGYSSDIDYLNFSNRTDYAHSDKWKTFARYSRFRTQVGEQNYTPNRSAALTNRTAGAMNSVNIAGDTVYMLSPTTVISARFSYGSLNDDYNAPDSKVGEEGLSQFWPNNPWYRPYIKDIPAIYYPALLFPTVPASTANSPTFGKATYYWQHPKTFNYGAKISKDDGRHYLKGGADIRYLRSDAVRPNLMSFAFDAKPTANTFLSPNIKLSGDAWATFLLGALDNTSQAQYIPRQNPQFDFYAGYFNDDFKITRNLTLTLGMRWELTSGPRDPENRLSRYLDLANPIPEMQSTPPNMPADVAAWRGKPYVFNGAWNFTDDANRNVWQASRTNFMPRLGLAYRLNDRTALRAGFARSIVPSEMIVDTLGSNAGYAGFDALTTVAPSLNGVPQARLSDPFPSTNPLILPVGKAYGRYTNLGANASWQQQDMRTAISDRITVSVQREILGRVLVEGTYFLNLGHDLPYTKNFNLIDQEIRYQYKTLLNQTVPNPFYQYLTADRFPGQLRNQKTVTKESLLTTYPQYLNVQQLNTNGFKDRYHSVQIKAQRAFNEGFMFVATYNYSRQKTSSFFNLDDEYAGLLTWLSSNLPRHRLSAAGTYNLPFGKGRKLLANANRVVDGILGGWSLSSLATINSGNFMRFAGLSVSGNPIIENPTPARWFDTSASVFSVLPAYTKRTNPWQYEGLTGPRNWNVDTTLSKMFPITERLRLEFRMEAYNLSNSFIPSDPVVAFANAAFGRCINQGNSGRELQYTARLHF